MEVKYAPRQEGDLNKDEGDTDNDRRISRRTGDLISHILSC
jgi:hypothetical protein